MSSDTAELYFPEIAARYVPRKEKYHRPSAFSLLPDPMDLEKYAFQHLGIILKFVSP